MKYSRWFHRQRGFFRLRAAIRQRNQLILSFHRVGGIVASEFLPSGLNCDPELFEQILRLLQVEARVLPLRELAEAPASVRGGVALTFDDAFRDNFTVVLPLLRRYGFSATLFATTDAVGSAELLPLHRYYFARQHGGVFAEPTDSMARRKHVEDFLRERRLVVPALGRELYLSHEELRAMADGDVEIGAHTCTHPCLADLSETEQRREIVESKQRLEQCLERPVESFAFPYGYRNSINAATADIVAEHFRVACFSGAVEPWQHGPLWCPRVNTVQFFQ